MKQEVIQCNKEKVKKLNENLYKFKDIGYFSEEGYAYAKKEDNITWCIIDLEGNIISEDDTEYRYRGLLNEGVSPVCNKEGKFGVVDIYGNTKIEFKYDYISDFYNGLAVARVGNLGGIINLNGEQVLPIKYKVFFFDLVEGVGSFKVDNEDYAKQRRVLIDLEGNEFHFKSNKNIEVDHYSISELLNQKPVVVRKMSDIKPDGKTLHSFRHAITNTRTLFRVDKELNKTSYYIRGNQLYSDENIFSLRMAHGEKEYMGYYNIYGETLVDIREFDCIMEYRNGFGVVGIFKKGEISFKVEGKNVKGVSLDRKWTFINRLGEIGSAKYDYISPLSMERELTYNRNLSYVKDLAIVDEGKCKGLINSDGDVLIPCKYKNIRVIYHGVAICYTSEESFIIELF